MSTRRALITLIALVFGLAACQVESTLQPVPSGSAELRPVTLLLSYQPDVQFAPFYVAQQRGYFAAAGLKVTIEHRDGPDVIRLVADGQAELGVADATDVMISRTSGIPITYAATLYGRFPVVLIGAKGTVPADPAGLAGLRIGTPGRYGSSWVALLALLDAGGLTADDVTIREYPSFNQVDGLLNGDVDLITGFRVNEPLRLAAQGMAVDTMAVDELAPLPGPGLVVGDELLASDRELVVAFARAVVQAQQAIAADVSVGLDAATVEVPAIADDPDTARAVLEASVEVWRNRQGTFTGGIDTEVWQSGYDILRRLDLIDGSVPLDKMYDAVLGAG